MLMRKPFNILISERFDKNNKSYHLQQFILKNLSKSPKGRLVPSEKTYMWLVCSLRLTKPPRHRKLRRQVRHFRRCKDSSLFAIEEALSSKDFAFSNFIEGVLYRKNGDICKLSMSKPRDQVVERLLMIMLCHNYEDDFPSNSYGYLPGSAPLIALHDFLTAILENKHRYILVKDIKRYFESVQRPHSTPIVWFVDQSVSSSPTNKANSKQ